MSARLGDEARRELLAAWVRDHGIDPSDVPIDTVLEVKGDQLTIEVFVRGADGRVRLDPSVANKVLRTRRTVPLVRPMPSLKEGETDG